MDAAACGGGNNLYPSLDRMTFRDKTASYAPGNTDAAAVISIMDRLLYLPGVVKGIIFTAAAI